MPEIRKELQSLLKACRILMRSILTVSNEDVDPRSWPVRIRTAKRYVHEAVLSLNLELKEESASQRSLEQLAASHTPRLVQDLMAEVDRESAPELAHRVSTLRERAGFHGYTWAISLPDLMGFLQMQQKSGILRVNIGTEVVSLIFDDGDLIHTSSDNSPPGARLGEILVEDNAIDMENLERFLVRYSASPGRLGDALEAGGLITKEALMSALDRQVALIFERLFASEDGYYSFREGRVEEAFDVRRNVFQLLLETCRVQDELSSDESDAVA